MRSTLSRFSLLLVASFVVMLPMAAHADTSSGWIVPGLGAVWPPAEFGTDDPLIAFGGIMGFRVSPPFAVELRAHFANGDSAKTGGAHTRLNHGEGNLTYFFAHEGAISPYLTGGLGAVRIKRSNATIDETDSKFAYNIGAGVRFQMSDHMSLRFDGRDVRYEVADGSGDSKYRNAPEIFGGVSFGFGGKPSDEDGDGVANKVDKCPATPAGARVDATGCPMDSDHDGVFDGIDKCDNTPAGATVDATGCPMDGDKDGVFDGIDTCPDTPAGAKVDAAGCPLDSDADGIPDGLDQCEGTPRGCTVNPNGCQTDTDQDGVCDGMDKCPDTQPNVRVDVTGCPIQVSVKETEMIETGMIRLQNINFETGKAIIKDDSYATLDDVGNILTHWPQLRIEIGGHTDSMGGDALNQSLSEARAKAVLDYLTNKYPQLSAGQFTTVGYGEKQPVSSNKTALGRAKNRRVEFKVLNKDALKKQTEKQEYVPK